MPWYSTYGVIRYAMPGLHGDMSLQSPRAKNADVPASRRAVPLTDRGSAQSNGRLTQAGMRRDLVVREERVGLTRPLGNTEKDGKTGSCIRFQGAIVESPSDPIVHKLRDDIVLQRMLEEPG